MIKGLNQYIDQEKPWQIAKTNDTEHLREVLAYQASSLLQIADLLTPLLPDTAEKIKIAFNQKVIHKMTENLFPRNDHD